MWDWLMAPVDASRVHEVGALLSWHGRLMVIAWGVLVPLGILIARFFKIAPWQSWPKRLDNRFWWYCHLTFQITGYTLMVLAILLIWDAPRHADHAGVHWLFGWSVFFLATMQVLGGYLRGTKGGPTAPAPDGSWRGDHYDMTPRRVLFERVHKSLGYLAVATGAATLLTGLWQANAPRGLFVILIVWWLFLGYAFVFLQRRGMAVDTYQAIWGPDPRHPGNVRDKPIGIGISRPSDNRRAVAGE